MLSQVTDYCNPLGNLNSGRKPGEPSSLEVALRSNHTFLFQISNTKKKNLTSIIIKKDLRTIIREIRKKNIQTTLVGLEPAVFASVCERTTATRALITNYYYYNNKYRRRTRVKISASEAFAKLCDSTFVTIFGYSQIYRLVSSGNHIQYK